MADMDTGCTIAAKAANSPKNIGLARLHVGSVKPDWFEVVPHHKAEVSTNVYIGDL